MYKINIIFIILIALACQLLAQPPNVIIIMTDDQGYGELSIHGNPILKTPHLDALAKRSQRFKEFHVAPMCTPTRSQLLTGLDAAKNGAVNVSSGRALLRPELKTMANYFLDSGYNTGLFGKWHLGSNYPFRPTDRGFQKAIWFPSSHIGSVPDHWGNDYFDDTYLDGTKPRAFKGYCTDIFFDEAMTFMKKSAKDKKPFLTYLATNTPHGPLIAKKEDRIELEKAINTYKKKTNHKEIKTQSLSNYLGMVKNIDDNMGRLNAFLENENLKDNTIIIFLTDNGSTYGHSYFNAGMRGRKTQVWEGGHRAPLFVSWPKGKFVQSREIEGLTQVQDILPTLLDLCEIPSHQPSSYFDGQSLAGILRGKEKVDPERKLVIAYSRMPGPFPYPAPEAQTAVRPNNSIVLYKHWRLLEDRVLNNLQSDPLQEKNVIDQYPEITKKMRLHLNQWWSNVKDKIDEPQRVIIGHDKENPSRITACEWLDVFIDQQRQISKGNKKYGYWLLDVAQKGTYEFELRRWPRGVKPPSEEQRADIKKAYFYITGTHHSPLVDDPTYGFRGKVSKVDDDLSATFTHDLDAGPIALHTWFDNGMSAYYVHVKRLE